MFTCFYVWFREPKLSHYEEEDAVIHSSKSPFEVRVCCIYVLLGEFSVFVHHNVSGEAIVYFPVGSEAICSVAKYT